MTSSRTTGRLPCWALLAVLYSTHANAASLTVQITRADPGIGQIAVALFNSQESFLETAIFDRTQLVAESDTLIFEFSDLTPGEYAISTFYDKNENGKLDTRFLGIPKEPFGFSNNPSVLFGPPSFDKTKIHVDDGPTEIEISLKSF